MKSRNASAVLFGFDFQINAAIVLMLDNIKDLKSLKLEGNYEDIELTFNNGDIVLAQAKAVVNSSYDFRNVRQNLNKALKSLSEGCRKTGSQKAIFITNSPNPFNDDESKSVFCGLSRRKFCDIPPSAQNIIRDYLKDINDPINPEYAAQLNAINERMLDLLMPFRYRGLYRPCQNGSASIKQTLPAFVPEMSYENMGIHNGTEASEQFMAFMQGKQTPEQTATMMQNLHDYCGQDTLAMVKLLEVVQGALNK